MAKFKLKIPVLVTNGGDGSVGLIVLHTEEQQKRYMEQMDDLNEDGSNSVMDEGDHIIEIEVDSDGTWSTIKRFSWQKTPEELIADRDQRIENGDE